MSAKGRPERGELLAPGGTARSAEGAPIGAVAASPALPAAAAVDVVFDVAGAALPADHAWLLLAAIAEHLPWLPGEGGVHPLRAAATSYGEVLLPQRAKLRLRVPEARAADALGLAHRRLAVADRPLAVGAGTIRELRPASTLAAHGVTSAAADSVAFEREAAGALAARAIVARVIAGRARRGASPVRVVAGFALTVHDLRPGDSLRLQYAGLGDERGAGWGVFVPAKTIAGIEGGY